ncbi:MAG TPA: alpha/beta fold hydrolase [Bryobacteraceae bacterium]|nr:alpha/beta fold hydrolase [Bryobacteraceae bacterium]
MRPSRRQTVPEFEAVSLPIWQELLAGVEMAFLRISPVFWGHGIPRGDGSAVVVVPGFLGTDHYLYQFRAWLRRIGYEPYDSGFGLNAECPNLLIRQRLNEAIGKAWASTGRKIHLIGHSLGGTIVRSAASQRPDRIASVITLGAPIQGIAAHSSVLHAAELVRKQILERNGKAVLPDCYTGLCTCNFLESLKGRFPKSVRQTAIYTKTDGILDWRVCRTGDPTIDFEVSATHIGLVFSPLVYDLVARRLAGK